MAFQNAQFVYLIHANSLIVRPEFIDIHRRLRNIVESGFVVIAQDLVIELPTAPFPASVISVQGIELRDGDPFPLSASFNGEYLIRWM